MTAMPNMQNGRTDERNGSLNDRPLFLQPNRLRGAGSLAAGDAAEGEISAFRSALPQFLAVSVKNILLFVYGMTLGFPTIVIPAIQGGDGRREPHDIVLNRDEISWFSSINLICVPLGCIFSGALTQPIGKRRAMQIVNLPILASWLLFHFSTRTEHLYAALCLSGLGGGLMEAPVLTYVAEIAEPKYRGILSALGSTCVITGVFITFIFGSLLDWRTIAAVCTAFPVICIVALCFIPESPTWLIRERRFREAVKALQWLRGWVPEYQIEAEFNRLYEELITAPALEAAEESRDMKPSKCATRFRMFRKRSFWAPFILVTFTFFTGHFSGKTPLQTYAVQIFHTLKAPINKYHATILLGIAEMIATILCVFLIHFTGKRFLVLFSTIGVSLCFFGTAYYAYYLNVVPGFAVNNVVANATGTLLGKENIISQQNITNIFETEKIKVLQLIADQAAEDKIAAGLNGTREMDSSWPDFLNSSDPVVGNEMANGTRSRRDDGGAALPFNTSYNPFNQGYGGTDDDNLTNEFIDLFERGLDYVDDSGNATRNLSSLIALDDLDLSDSAEETTMFNRVITTSTAKTTTMASKEGVVTDGDDHLPTTKEVVDELLLPVPKQERNTLVWLPLILILGAAFFAHCGIRMIPWILIGEVFPASIRSTASGLVSALGYIFGFLANKLFLQMLNKLTLPGTFFFYSAVAATGAIVLYFCLPETENRTLAEIEAHFSKKSNFNLLRKPAKDGSDASATTKNAIQLENLQNLQMPISPQLETKILQLQQSDFVGPQANQHTNSPTGGGAYNLAFRMENNNTTTHL